jgi:hypothetical protein
MTISSPANMRPEQLLEWMRERTRRTRLERPRPVLPRGSVIQPPSPALSAARRRLSALLAGAAGGAGGPPVRTKKDPVLRLVDRITQGFNKAEYDRARALGYEDYLEEQLDHLSIDDSEMDERLAGLTTLQMSPKEIIDNYPTDITAPYYEIKGAALLRSVMSRRQLFERMVEFWNDHFSLDHNKGDFMYPFKPEDDRTVIRPNALGGFPAMLSASFKSGAMLFYLDNWLNVAGAPQENYARELMELHTMGVGGGYTEDDIKQVARCFTGWTLNSDYSSPDYLRGVYVNAYHAGGDKVVLGVTIPAFPPRQNAQRVLDILMAHPSTARFIATKLIRWFLTESPPQALVDQVAQVFTDTNGDIKSMLRVILARPNLEWSSPYFTPKFRRPFHLATSLLRGLQVGVSDFYYALFYLYTMGHSPFDWSPPNGYPDTVDFWGGSLLPRWTFTSDLMSIVIPGLDINLSQVLGLLEVTGPGDASGLAKRINRRILGETLSQAEVDVVQEYIDSQASPTAWPKVCESIALAASLPGNQWY